MNNFNSLTGIIVATPQELKSLCSKKINPGLPHFLRDDLVIILSGVGAKAAEKAALQLVDMKVSRIISWGAAGGIKASVVTGTLVIPEFVIDQENNIYCSDHNFNKQLMTKLPAGLLITTDPLFGESTLLNSQHEKESIHQITKAVAVDMESGAIARVAAENKLDFNVIRSISDDVYTKVPQSITRAIDPNGQIHSFSLLSNLLFSPQDWISIIQLAKGFWKAKKSLKLIAKVILKSSVQSS